MKKDTLLIIIDNLKKGGAEVLLVGILQELNSKYEVILVTLTGENDFPEDKIICSKKYVLGFHDKLSFIACIFKLKGIIKRTSPVLIHAHLFYSSLLARLACPSGIPVVYSVHNELSKNIFNNNSLYKALEKLTIRKNHIIVAVSKLVLDDYIQAIRATKRQFILRNYISDDFFTGPAPKVSITGTKKLRIIAVGNLKESKNYEYLLHSLIGLDNYSITLDVYGNTEYKLFPQLKDLVEKHNLGVTFKGKVDNIKEIFSSYDLYIMSSKYEGFGIAAVEAMSVGLPVLLSDIPVLREVTFDNALFFNIEDPQSLTNLFKEIVAGKYDLNEYSSKGIDIAKKYTRQNYLESLLSIYDDVLHTTN